MRIDTFFRAARGKHESQDYSIHDDNNVILCDGCTSSPLTEIGSRLLAHSALSWINHYDDPLYDPSLIINSANFAANNVGLPQECLDCTLLTIRLRGDKTYINCFGDGAIAYDGNIISLKYSNNYPYYISYLLDKDRHDAWVAGNHKFTANGFELSIPRFNFELLNFNRLAIFSDGIEQFEGKEPREVINETFAIKTTKDKFLKRRCNHISKDHEDDFSVGMVLNEN